MPIITGYNSSVAAGTETIWGNADAVWVPPTVARVHAIVSSDVDDNSGADTGARTLLVTGFGTGWVPLSEIVTLHASAGTTSVNTANSYLHIDRMEVLTAGSTGANEGLITATAATDATITAAIAAGLNVSNGAILYCGILGQQYHVRSAVVSASGLTDGATSIEVRLAHKANGALLTLQTIACIWSGAGSTVTVPLDILLRPGEWIRLDATSTDAAARVAATISYVQAA